MLPEIILVDINKEVTDAWRVAFAKTPGVEIITGSMLKLKVSAWVSPTNSKGNMNGGLDAAIKNELGARVEKRLQKEIKEMHDGSMPIGYALCLSTKHSQPKFLISTPTMEGSNDDIRRTFNVALATAAALNAAKTQNEEEPGSIVSIALPGLGANTGQVSPKRCAEMMQVAYSLCRYESFKTHEGLFNALTERLQDELGL